jgi:hypothetical protein
VPPSCKEAADRRFSAVEDNNYLNPLNRRDFINSSAEEGSRVLALR